MILVDDSKANWACLILSLAAITETLTCFSLTYRMVSNFTNFLVFCYYIFQCFFKIFFVFIAIYYTLLTISKSQTTNATK